MTDWTSGSVGRRWLRKAVPVGVVALLGVGVSGPALAGSVPAASAGSTLSLPAPTGPHRAGTVRLHLVDPSRIDPTSPTHGVREIMVQIWYPATDAHGTPAAPYMPPLAAAHFLASAHAPAGTTLPRTTGHVGAPAERRPHPVVLYSPGGINDGSLDTGLVEDLVGHGYVVVTMDDTNDSAEVEFPGGRLVIGTVEYNTLDDLIQAEQIRADDARFVLDKLTVLNNGGNPDAEHAPLPVGLAGSFDLSRVGMFGWSLGGVASAQAMHDDSRIKAAVNLDGTFYGPVADIGADRPFLLMTDSEETEQNDPSLVSFLAASTGPKLHLGLANSQHTTFSDGEELISQLGPILGLSSKQIADSIGTIDPTTAVTDERVYLRAFFDLYLRHHDNHLLDGPSPQFPDIQFQP